MLIKKFIVWFLQHLCTVLDHLPGFGYARKYGWWFSRYGDWGCHPLHLSALSVRLDEKWQTNVWKESA